MDSVLRFCRVHYLNTESSENTLLETYLEMLLKKDTDSLELFFKKTINDNDKLNLSWALFNKYRRSDGKRALEMANEEIRFARKLGFDLREANGYRHHGICFHTLGARAKAIESFLHATRFYEKRKNLFKQAACLNNIGLVYLEQRSFDDAITYFKQALNIWKTIQKGGDEGVSIALNNLGSSFNAKGDYYTALDYFTLSIGVARKVDNVTIIGESLEGIGSIYVHQKKFKQALPFLNDALKQAIKTGNKHAQANIFISLCRVRIAQRRLKVALSLAQKSLAISHSFGDRNSIAQSYKQISQVYALMGEFTKAYQFEHRYNLLNDSIDNTSAIREIERLQYDYKLEKKEMLNRALIKDKKLKEIEISLREATIEKQLIFSSLVLVILVLCGFAAFIFYKNLKNQKRVNRLLRNQKKEITMRSQEVAAQNEEITARNEEISSQNEEIQTQNDELNIQHIKLYQQKEDLVKINLAQRKILTIISHDLRAPFSNIMGVTKLFQDDLLQMDEMKGLTEKLSERTQLAIQLLDNLLQWSRSQMEGVDVLAIQFDITKVIEDTVQLMRVSAQQKRIEIRMEVKNELNAFADQNMIATVIRNLIANAIKFSYDGGVISIWSFFDDTYIYISVRDAGVGIPEEVIDKLFDQNTYYTTKGTMSEVGTGLGLGLCREFIGLNGGNIKVESRRNSGSTFTFTIPRGHSR